MKISYSRGATINTGNYNSIRLDISHELECNEDNRDEKFKQLKDYVDTQLKKAIDKAIESKWME